MKFFGTKKSGVSRGEEQYNVRHLTKQSAYDNVFVHNISTGNIMAASEAHKRAQRNYRLKKLQSGKVPARYYTPKEQYDALAKLAEKKGQSIEAVTNELLATCLKKEGYKF